MHTKLPFAFIGSILCSAVAAPAHAATIGVIGNVSWQPTPGGGNATRVNGANLVVNPADNPMVRIDVAVRASEGDHQGLAVILYGIFSPEAQAKGYFFSPMQRACSGFNSLGGPIDVQNISAPMYDAAQPCPPPSSYGGGWGFTNNGQPFGGDALFQPGAVRDVRDMAPNVWSGDNSPSIDGIQSFARLGVGQGLYKAAPEDPFLAGQTLGFGADVANGVGGGNGEWWLHSLFLDVTHWDRQTYTFNINAIAGAVLLNGPDYSQPHVAFHQGVIGSALIDGEVSFTLIPEPALSLVLFGALTLIRRR